MTHQEPDRAERSPAQWRLPGVLVLELPCDPSMLVRLSANGRGHWAKTAGITKAWRKRARIEAKSRLNTGTWPRLERADIVCTLTWPTRHHRDAPNWHPVAKAIVDGLVDAGLLPDDDDTHVTGPDMRRNPATGPHAVTLTITPLALLP